MNRRPRGIIPAAVFLLGPVVTSVGLAYGVFFAGGVPSQDLSPEQRANEQFHFDIGFAVLFMGVGIAAVGLVWLVIGHVLYRKPDRPAETRRV